MFNSLPCCSIWPIYLFCSYYLLWVIKSIIYSEKVYSFLLVVFSIACLHYSTSTHIVEILCNDCICNQLFFIEIVKLFNSVIKEFGMKINVSVLYKSGGFYPKYSGNLNFLLLLILFCKYRLYTVRIPNWRKYSITNSDSLRLSICLFVLFALLEF